MLKAGEESMDKTYEIEKLAKVYGECYITQTKSLIFRQNCRFLQHLLNPLPPPPPVFSYSLKFAL